MPKTRERANKRENEWESSKEINKPGVLVNGEVYQTRTCTTLILLTKRTVSSTVFSKRKQAN